MVPSEDTCHMSRVHKCVSKLVNFFGSKISKNPAWLNWGHISPIIFDVLWSICHIGHPFKTVLQFCTYVFKVLLPLRYHIKSHLKVFLEAHTCFLQNAPFSEFPQIEYPSNKPLKSHNSKLSA